MYAVAYGGGSTWSATRRRSEDATGSIPDAWAGRVHVRAALSRHGLAVTGQMRVASLITSSWHVPVGQAWTTAPRRRRTVRPPPLGTAARAPSFVELRPVLHGGTLARRSAAGHVVVRQSCGLLPRRRLRGRLMGTALVSLARARLLVPGQRARTVRRASSADARVDVRTAARCDLAVPEDERLVGLARLRLRHGHANPRSRTRPASRPRRFYDARQESDVAVLRVSRTEPAPHHGAEPATMRRAGGLASSRRRAAGAWPDWSLNARRAAPLRPGPSAAPRPQSSRESRACAARARCASRRCAAQPSRHHLGVCAPLGEQARHNALLPRETEARLESVSRTAARARRRPPTSRARRPAGSRRHQRVAARGDAPCAHM
jgi:hypothetical protein